MVAPIMLAAKGMADSRAGLERESIASAQSSDLATLPISRLFHEDAQGAQVINLSILHHGLLWDHRLLQNERLRGALDAGIG